MLPAQADAPSRLVTLMRQCSTDYVQLHRRQTAVARISISLCLTMHVWNFAQILVCASDAQSA